MKNDYQYRADFVRELGSLVNRSGLDFIDHMELIDDGKTVFVCSPSSGSRCVWIWGDSLLAICEDVCRALYGKDNYFDPGYDYDLFIPEFGKLIHDFGTGHHETCGIESISYDNESGYATIHFGDEYTRSVKVKGLGIFQAARAIALEAY